MLTNLVVIFIITISNKIEGAKKANYQSKMNHNQRAQIQMIPTPTATIRRGKVEPVERVSKAHHRRHVFW